MLYISDPCLAVQKIHRFASFVNADNNDDNIGTAQTRAHLVNPDMPAELQLCVLEAGNLQHSRPSRRRSKQFVSTDLQKNFEQA